MSDTPLAPIALFVYNRREHTQRTVEALAKNPEATESDLFVFSDGAKNEPAELAVREVRSYLKTISGFKTVTITEHFENFGLAKSVISGVSEIIGKFGRAIILEDDLVTSPHFLRYMNEALSLYKDDPRVASIHGYIYPVEGALPETFFIRGADCWGWATWKRAWDKFEPDGQKLLTNLKQRHLTREFDFGGAYPYTMMLENQIMGVNNSWAIRWYASAFLAEMFTLYPGRSLVDNIGMDDSGENSGRTNIFRSPLTDRPITLSIQEPVEDERAKRSIAALLRRTGLNSPLAKLKFLIKKFLYVIKKH
jgi:hypothetical protein